MTQVFDVIVVGCGGAGVAALTRLHNNGLTVLGLEASSRLGGRIFTLPYGENVVDMGAQWCHGEKDNAVYDLVKDLDVIGPPSVKKKVQYLHTANKEATTQEKIEECVQVLESIVRREKNSPTRRNSYPIYGHIKDEYNSALRLNKIDVDDDLATRVKKWYVQSIQAKISANELLEKSLNSLRESWDNDGEQWLDWKDGGYKTIIDILMKSHPDQPKVNIEFNKEVINIKWGNSRTAGNEGNSVVQIQCRDGSLFMAKHAVVTVSLGVLKERHEQLFTPSVPDEKLMAIRSVAVCTMNKIYLRFDNAWWTGLASGATSFALLWSDEDEREFVDEDDWLTGVYQVSTVDRQPKMLCAWVVGTAAENMELCLHDDVAEGLFRLLKHFFGAGVVEKPLDVLRSTWYTNSLTRGSFSYRSVETECMGGGAAALAEPLKNGSGEPVVCFAGEATSQRHHSTAHGALESGFREADRLLALFRK